MYLQKCDASYLMGLPDGPLPWESEDFLRPALQDDPLLQTGTVTTLSFIAQVLSNCLQLQQQICLSWLFFFFWEGGQKFLDAKYLMELTRTYYTHTYNTSNRMLWSRTKRWEKNISDVILFSQPTSADFTAVSVFLYYTFLNIP